MARTATARLWRSGLRFAAKADVMALVEAEVLARRLARYIPLDDAARAAVQRVAEVRSGQEYLNSMGITRDARELDPWNIWGGRTPRDRLRVPIGKDGSGQMCWLDMKEDSEGGMGPHGQLVGWTGSGKSTLLREIVIGLALLHPPDELRMLLGDFKGEAEFSNLAPLPHVVGVVSDLEGSQSKLNRFRDVLLGESNIRKEILADAGYKNVSDYELARATTRPELPPLGSLVIILDEFAQLLKILPEIGEVIDGIGIQGRARWMYVLVASQLAAGMKTKWLTGNLGYNIVMKVKTAGDGREAGSARAYEELRKSPPGTGFLVVDGEHTKFRSFYTQAPFVAPKPAARNLNTDGDHIPVHRFTPKVAPLPDYITEVDDGQDSDDQAEQPGGVDAPTVESVLIRSIVERGAIKGEPARVMWLPPLDDVGELTVYEMAQEFWGKPFDQLDHDNGLVVPYGREDNPLRHSQDLISFDVSGAMGNVAVTGTTGTGKSTALCTLAQMLAVSHSPARVQVYGVDYGGGMLKSLSGLPHMCSVAGQGDADRLRRIVTEVERVLRFRKRNWGEVGLDLETFRKRKFGGEGGVVPDDGHGDVFLVVDGIRALKNEAVEVHDRIVALAEGALNYGIHVFISCDSWIFTSTTLDGKLGSRIELRLADHTQSKTANKADAKEVPKQPGRGLQTNGNHLLVGVPYIRRAQGASEMEAREQAVTTIAGLWAQRGVARAPELQLLPVSIAYDKLPASPDPILRLGIGERDMYAAAAGVDLGLVSHCYIAGSSRSGRTTALRTLLASIENSYAPPDLAHPSAEQAQVIVLDPGRKPGDNLADAISTEYRRVYASNVEDITELGVLIAKWLVGRQPPRGLPPEELERWEQSAPQTFVVIDDLHLLSVDGGSRTVLAPLVNDIKRARQVGLHVLAATTSENWHSGGNMNQIVKAMKESAAVLILDGPPGEIIVDKVRPATRPPGRGELYYRQGGGQLIQVAVA